MALTAASSWNTCANNIISLARPRDDLAGPKTFADLRSRPQTFPNYFMLANPYLKLSRQTSKTVSL
jgi:hypothetical protein